jgi:hypothetical protein
MRPLKHTGSQFLGGAKAWYVAGGAPVPVAAYRPKGAASLAASYVNLANPGTNNAAPGTAPTFAAATGWGFTGASSQYLTTGVAATGTLTVVARYSAFTLTGSLVLFGSMATNKVIQCRPRFNATDMRHAWGNGAATTFAAVGGAAGVIAMAGPNVYFDGASVGTLPGALVGTGDTLYIAAANTTDVASLFATCNVQALAIYSTILTAPQVAAVTLAMQNL